MITINTNQTTTDNREEFEAKCQDLFNNSHRVISTKPGYEPLTLENSVIEVLYSLEEGKMKKRCHMHARVTIQHDTCILVDYRKLQVWRKKVGIPYANSELVDPTPEEQAEFRVDKYITKTKTKPKPKAKNK